MKEHGCQRPSLKKKDRAEQRVCLRCVVLYFVVGKRAARVTLVARLIIAVSLRIESRDLILYSVYIRLALYSVCQSVYWHDFDRPIDLVRTIYLYILYIVSEDRLDDNLSIV